MRKFYSRLLPAFILLLSSLAATAQISGYVFSQSSGTYAPITGGTVHASTTTAWDDNVYSGTIGFGFTFNGASYNTVNINSNGYLTFGTTAPGTTLYSPISSTTGYAGAISAFSRDLIANTANNSEIRSETIGSAPNRTYVVQWTNARRYSGGAITGDVLNFQIRLNETTNVIDIVYGTNTAVSTTLTGQTGIRGATNAAYSNRTTTTNWSASTAGASNAATMTTSATVMPPSGLTFTWTPPALPPVDLSFVGFTGLPASTCPNNSVPVTTTIRNMGANTLDFSTANTTITVNVTGASTQTLTVTLNNGTLAPNATMDVPVFPNANFSAGGTHTLTGTVAVAGDGISTNNSGTAPVNISYLTTSPWSEAFATTTAPTGWNTSGWSIANNHAVSSNGIYKNLWASAPTGQFSTIMVGPVTANDFFNFQYRILNWASTYPGTEVPPTGNWGNFKVQISTNCGATFTDLATIDNTNHTVTDQSWTTKSYPLAAYVGQNVMFRINATWVSGDYFIDFDNFNVFAACSGTPAGGSAAASSTTVCIGGSTNLSLTGATSGVGGLSYQWRSSSDGVTYNDITGANLATYTATGITSNTYFKAVVTCANGSAFDESDPILVSVSAPQTVPFTEGFETVSPVGAGLTPGCWSTQLITGANFTTANTAVRNGLGARTGTNYIWSRWSSDAWLFTPAIQLTAGTSYDFSFWYRQTDAVSGFVLTTAVGSANNGAAMTTTLGTITNPVNTAYTQAKYSFTPTTTGVYYFGVRSNANGDPWYLTYDDFAVELTPPCNAPNTVTISGLTNNAASANFTPTGTSYIVEYGPAGFTPGTGGTPGSGGTIVTGGTSPINMAGLTSNTAYDVYK